MSTTIADLRKEYTQNALELTEVNPDPIVQFQQWFEEAQSAQVPEPNAMNLATVSPEGQPTSRIVLLKGVQEGFIFYSNYESHKGKAIAQNRYVALTFFWPELERQIRIEGQAEKISEAQSTAYFHSRPRGSQIGAWTSPQSEIVEDRSVLTQRQEAYTREFEGKEVPKPDHWGGYQVLPDRIEFWQGRPSRLHDRILYTLQKDDSWKIQRLAP